MTLSEFRIGVEFVMPNDHYQRIERYRVTDVGSRTVVAIRLDALDESWYAGPPYAVGEVVIDEHDMPACRPVAGALSS